MQSNSIRVTVQDYVEVEDPMGTVKEWQDVETYWGKKGIIGIDGQEKFQQIGHSEVDFWIIFSHAIDLNLSEYRLEIEGKYYEIIEPPTDRGVISREKTIVPVREVPDDE